MKVDKVFCAECEHFLGRHPDNGSFAFSMSVLSNGGKPPGRCWRKKAFIDPVGDTKYFESCTVVNGNLDCANFSRRKTADAPK